MATKTTTKAISILEMISKNDTLIKENKATKKVLTKAISEASNELFNIFISNYNDKLKDISVITSKQAKQAKQYSFNILNESYAIKSQELLNIVTAFEKYSQSKIYLDLNQKEFINDVKNPAYISKAMFIKYFTNLFKGDNGEVKLFENNISNNKDFVVMYNQRFNLALKTAATSKALKSLANYKEKHNIK